MKLLLVMPKYVDGSVQSYEIPLGLPYISSALKQAGHEVHCVNLNHEEGEPDEFIERLVRELEPDACGSGSLSSQIETVKTVFNAARRAKPDIVNIAGGGVLSSAPELVADILDIDIGVIADGEITIVEIAEAFDNGTDRRDLEGIDGIVYQNRDGAWVKTPARAANKDLDSLPWPDFESFKFAEYLDLQEETGGNLLYAVKGARRVPMVRTRSCPFSCTFCYHPSGHVYRRRGLDDFFAELDELIDRYNVNTVMIYDELFEVKKSLLLEFCDRMKDYNMSWSAQFHVGIIDEEVIDALKESGCKLISYGIESINDDILISMQKKTTQKAIENALELTYDRQIEIQGNFIFGDQAETLDTINYTLDWWAKNKIYQINLSYIQVYHGSKVYLEALENGLVADEEKHYFNPDLNISTLDEAAYRRLHQRIAGYYEMITVPGKVLSCAEEAPGPDGLMRYNLHWECPRCGNDNEYGRVSWKNPKNYQKIRFPCRSCFARIDVRNPVWPPWSIPEMEALYHQAAGKRQAGDLKGAKADYKEILEAKFPNYAFHRPTAWIMAAFDLGNIYMEEDGKEHLAIGWLFKALRHNVFEPLWHLTVGRAMILEGSYGAAIMHFEQAKLLNNGEAQGTTELSDKLIQFCQETGNEQQLGQYFY